MTLIILHGWGHNKALWENAQNQLSTFIKTEAFDMPGFGKEKLIDDNWDIPDYAAWVKSKIEENEHKNVILLGHSFGGKIAAQIASENPKWLKGLILSGAPCLRRPSLFIKTKIIIYKLLKKLIPHNFVKYFLSKDLSEAKAKNLDKIFRNAVEFDQTSILPKIKVKTLLVWGESDTEVPLRVADEIVELISNSKLETIENAGHNAYLDKPNLLYGLIKNYISNL